jgi:predicted ATPase
MRASRRTSRGAHVTGEHNLPSGLSGLAGRKQELADVLARLETSRLVTLTGAGGVGKTRIALAVAAAAQDAYPDGIRLASLGPLIDPALVPHAVAAVFGVAERSGRPLVATLIQALRRRRSLLVLGNCEHLIQACAELAEALLGACPELAILATSHEPLGLAGEVTWRVPSLSLPAPPQPPPEQLSQYAAVRLFIERAVAARPDFQVTNANAPAVAEVCSRLDG